ncbi:MAG: right-handed parallel beta-helix repeat-containing protein [Ardenticatenaceae bacterium]|nr:right-handed parallel beta-helix repeat-containing protein [Ardenticatenaceae bacterium]
MASRIKRFFFIILIPLLTLMSMLQLWPNRATAATITVINTNDGGAGSLRAAVAAAEANPGPDKITFDPGLDGSTISLTSGALTLSGTVEIDATNLAGGIEISGGDLDRVFFIESSAVVTLTHLTLISGTSQFGSGSCNTLCGGALYASFDSQVTIQDSEIHGSRANGGGGIYNEGTMDIVNSLVHNNFAKSEGGGVRNSGQMTIVNSSIISNVTEISGDPDFNVGGGGIYVDLFNNLALQNSTVAYNQASGSGGGILGSTPQALTVSQSTIAHNSATSSGGGLFLKTDLEYVTSSIKIENSTVSQNVAEDAGGAIYGSATMSSTLMLTVTHGTLYSNTAAAGGGIYQTSDITSTATATIKNTIILGSTGGNCQGVGGNQHNLADDDSCPGFRQGNPALGPLMNNGGSTETHALLLGGLPVGMGDPAVCQAVGVDQRNVPRSQPTCDSGAYENTTDFLTLFLPFTQKE